MKKKVNALNTIIITIIVALLYLGLLFFSIEKNRENSDKLLFKDSGNLYPTYVKKVIKETQVEDIKTVLKEAEEKNLKVSIAGKQHSQGGHTYYKDAVVLDMNDFNEIINLDKKDKIITVQSGVNWDQIQRYINPYNLSVKTMQSSNIFTIGGSMSSNIHGRDLEKTSLIDTIKSFRFLLANGTIINVNRTENSELFYLVNGGYGLFGVILEVDIELTDNVIYEQKAVLVNYKDFEDYFEKNIKSNSNIGLFMARPSMAPSSLLNETIVWTWEKTNKTKEGVYILGEEEHVARDKFFFGLSRKFNLGKELLWKLEKRTMPKDETLVTSNNAMRPPVAPLELFTDYRSESDVDLIQEYFIPTENFVSFADGLRDIIQKENVNILSFTIRHVNKNNESFLSYSPSEDAFAIIVFANYKLNEKGQRKAERAIQSMVDLAIENNGTYYLTYNLYPSQEQIRKAYPNIDEFFEKKKEYDPQERFMNKFYEKYALGVEDEK